MTLLLNEIHVFPGFNPSFQIAAADRRTIKQGRFHSNRKKLFTIPYLKASISYFMMASFFRNGKEIYLSEWLPDFINRQHVISYDIETFCHNLRDELHQIISPNYLQKSGSSFHIACYHNNGLPDFYFMSNIDTVDNFIYKDFQPRYGDPHSDFLQRDAQKFGWDGANPSSVTKEGIWDYRNGDYKEHAVASQRIDELMDDLFKLNLNGYQRPKSIEEYANYVRFRFMLLTYIHSRWATPKTISPPIDVVILKSSGVREFRPQK